MILQTLVSFTTAFTLVTAAAPRGEAPTFDHDPDLTVAKVVENFRQANQLLLDVEEVTGQLEPEKEERVQPVVALLEEQLAEAASQLSTAAQIEKKGLTRASYSSSQSGSVDPEVFEGINSDILSVTNDLKQLTAALGNADYL